VNFVAHAHVALRNSRASWDEAFGAVVPDLASMARTRIERAGLPCAVQEGIGLHHRADKAFHVLESFQTGARRIRQVLTDAGLPAGPARAVGHAGFELLLDGCLLTRGGVRQEFEQMLACAPDIAHAVPPADADRWRELLRSMRDEKWWLGYEDPRRVAHALQRLLQARPRLRFSESAIPIVAAALTAERPILETVADDIIRSVTEAIQVGRLPSTGERT
jgi:acyl carrier protein phosphodiesterase